MQLTYESEPHHMIVRGGEASSLFMHFRDLHGAKSQLFTDGKSKAGLMFEAGGLLYILEDDDEYGGRMTVTRA